MHRLLGLDFVRGLAAIGIMLHHYREEQGAFSFSVLPASLSGIVGIYGVSIFFVMSGWLMWAKYAGIAPLDRQAVISFLIKRWFRIAPLLILATFIHYLIFRGDFFFKDEGGYQIFHDPARLLANLTFANAFYFGPDWSLMVMGGWSLQVEFAFYFAFAAFVFLIPTGWRIHVVLAALVAGVLYRSFITPLSTGLDFWPAYIHFFPQAAFFAAGALIAALRFKLPWPLLVTVGLVAAVAFVDVGGSVPGVASPYFSTPSYLFYGAICVLLVAAASQLKMPGLIGRVAEFIGDTSYSIYILHPLVLKIFALAVWKIGDLGWGSGNAQDSVLGYAFCIGATLGIAYLVFTYIESPMIRLGGRIAGNIPPSAPTPAIPAVAG